MVKTGTIALILTLLPLAAHAKEVTTQVALQGQRSLQPSACEMMLAQPTHLGSRKDGLDVGPVLAIPREVVDTLLLNTPPPAPATLIQSFVDRIKSLLGPTPATASPEMNVLIDRVQGARVTPAVRRTLERVASRLGQIQSTSSTVDPDQIPVRHILRGRLVIRDFVAGLADQTRLLQAELKRQAANLAEAPVIIPMIDGGVNPADLEKFRATDDDQPLPAREFARWHEIKLLSKLGAAGAVGGVFFASIFALDVHVAVPLHLALGGGLYYVSQTFRNGVNEILGGIKSLYRDRRASNALPTAARSLELRLDRVQNELNAYQDIVEHLSGKTPKHGFSYFAHEAEVVDPLNPAGPAKTVLKEMILFSNMKRYAMVTVVTNLDTQAATFTKLNLAP